MYMQYNLVLVRTYVHTYTGLFTLLVDIYTSFGPYLTYTTHACHPVLMADEGYRFGVQ